MKKKKKMWRMQSWNAILLLGTYFFYQNMKLKLSGVMKKQPAYSGKLRLAEPPKYIKFITALHNWRYRLPLFKLSPTKFWTQLIFDASCCWLVITATFLSSDVKLHLYVDVFYCVAFFVLAFFCRFNPSMWLLSRLQ